MLESSDLCSGRLSPKPPLGQLRATPTEPDVPAESRVRDRVRASASALFPHPTGRDTPSVGEFLGGQNFKERTLGWCVLCSELCSSAFHRFPFKEFQCMAVRRTAVFSFLFKLAATCNGFRSCHDLDLSALAVDLNREAGHVAACLVKLHTIPSLHHRSFGQRTVPRSSRNGTFPTAC
jgi:hypothetical protein